jgi:hypothetical protein
MEISNISRIGGVFRHGITLLVILGVSSCASGRKHTSTEVPTSPVPLQNGLKAAQSDVPYGPFPDGEAAILPAPAGSAAMISNPDRVVLVFGRGLTHGYAYVGVLRALKELKVPVHAIYATEVGALASSLYFTQPNINRFDWALLRFNEKNLAPSTGKFSFHLNSPENELDDRLKEVFNDLRVETFSDRLHIGLQDAKTGESLQARSGDLWRAVRGALAGANQFSPEDFEGRPVHAAATKIAESYRVARQSEKYPIVVVSAGEPPTELLRQLIESQKATFVYVPLPGIDDLDLKKRNQAVFAGKNTIHKAAKEILGLIGRKPEGNQ